MSDDRAAPYRPIEDAPEDDEPVTSEDLEAIREGLEAYARGEYVEDADLRLIRQGRPPPPPPPDLDFTTDIGIDGGWEHWLAVLLILAGVVGIFVLGYIAGAAHGWGGWQ